MGRKTAMVVTPISNAASQRLRAAGIVSFGCTVDTNPAGVLTSRTD
jgi:hypothetical protein